MTKYFILLAAIIAGGAISFAHFWVNTQPISFAAVRVAQPIQELPEMNRKIIKFIEVNGKDISPTYKSAVCTEFVIKVIERFTTLTKQERKDIRIITEKPLDLLVEHDDDVIKGVQTALLRSDKGVRVDSLNKVLPGDFVQFWTMYGSQPYGHCGIVAELNVGESLKVYSSHPHTNGYGVQEFSWPEKVYFVRLK